MAGDGEAARATVNDGEPRHTAGERGPAVAPGHPRPETRWERARSNVKTIGGAILLALFIRIVLFEPFEIEGPSMQPTLLNGDRVVVAKFLYGLFLPFQNEAVVSWGSPSVGDVVIVRGPRDNVDIVKRVVGVAGDTIEVRDGIIVRNGQAVDRVDQGECDARTRMDVYDGDPCVWMAESIGEHTYLTSQSAIGGQPSAPPTVVPDGDVYVMGDHRDRSNDSRRFGPVSVARVKGRALFIYWSNGEGAVRFGRLGHAIE